jgi:hypothetical protein
MNDFKKTIEAAEKLAASTKKLSEVSNKMRVKINPISLPNFSPPSLERYEFPELHIPSEEERNEYQSASEFMKALSDAAVEWKANLPEGYSPAIVALLYGGIQIQVQNLAQVSFHGIRIQGFLNEAPCTLLAHQSTVQMLCVAEEITEGDQRNPIGFIWPNNKVEV